MKKITFISLIICALALGVSYVNAQSKTATLNNEVVTDIDGNTYTTVTIGTQTWLVENLITTKYRNGDAIGTTPTANYDYSAEETPKYQWAWRSTETNVPTQGRYYTWFAVTDPRGIAPVGYRVATDQDYITLASYLIENGDIYSFDGLKNTGTVDANNKITKALASTTTRWTNTSTIGAPGNDKAANNASGLSLIPAGRRNPSGTDPWANPNDVAFLWTYDATLTNSANAIHRAIYNNSTAFITRPNGENKKSGFSVRCIKESVTTAIKTFNAIFFKVELYPSLVKEIFTININSAHNQNVSLKILTIDGKIVYQKNCQLANGNTNITANLSHLSKGIYLCRVNNSLSSNIIKFTKN